MDDDELLKLYTGGEKVSASKSKAKVMTDDDLLKLYTDRQEPMKAAGITIRPVAPPISGVSQEQSDIINAQPATPNTGNPRRYGDITKLPSDIATGVSELPSDMWQTAKKTYQGGVDTALSGLTDIGENRSATGVGKVAMGALTAIPGAAINAISENLIKKPVTNFTGNPDIGDKAEFVATAGLPVGKATKATIAMRPTNRAFDTLVKSIGPENAGEVARRMRENPRLSPADLSPAVKQDTQTLFTTEGPKHINYLSEATKARAESAKAAVEGAIDQGLGATVNSVDKLNSMKEAARTVGREQINPLIEATPHTDVTKVVKAIDNEIGAPAMRAIKEGRAPALPLTDFQRELLDIRKDLRGSWPDRPEMMSYTDNVHELQSKLRERAETLLGSATGSDKLLGGRLMEYRNKLVDAIDNSGPTTVNQAGETVGAYKHALSNYRNEKQIENAFHHGHDSILTSSRKLENNADAFEDWVKKAKPDELNAAREGARIAIDTQINGFKHAARRGTDIGEVEFNKQKIEALFGKEQAGEMFKKLKDEREIADTNNKLTQGSQTAMRMGSKKAFALPTAGEGARALIPPAIVEGASMLSGAPGGLATAAYGGARTITAAKDAAKMTMQRAHNNEYAKLALPTEGPSREKLIKDLEAVAAGHNSKQSLVRRGANVLSRVIAP